MLSQVDAPDYIYGKDLPKRVAIATGLSCLVDQLQRKFVTTKGKHYLKPRVGRCTRRHKVVFVDRVVFRDCGGLQKFYYQCYYYYYYYYYCYNFKKTSQNTFNA